MREAGIGRKVLFEREGQAAILDEIQAPEAELQEVVKQARSSSRSRTSG